MGEPICRAPESGPALGDSDMNSKTPAELYKEYWSSCSAPSYRSWRSC